MAPAGRPPKSENAFEVRLHACYASALHARPKPKTNQFRPLARVVYHRAGPTEQLPLLLQGSRSRAPVAQPGHTSHRPAPRFDRRRPRVPPAATLPRQDLGLHPHCVGGLILGRLRMALHSRPGRASLRRRSTSRPARTGLHFARQHQPACLSCPTVFRRARNGSAQSSASRFLSGILVTLLQPRVTRHPGRFSRVCRTRHPARGHQRRPARRL
jgi:hypothetical protein